MSNVYDNWERLVAATMRREELWQMFHDHSRTTSISSRSSNFSFTSAIHPELTLDFSSPDGSSPFLQNLQNIANATSSASNSESQESIKAENSFEENQLAPEDIIVNGRPLNQVELTVLLRCRNPPKKLKQGNYWYDRVSGFWGKQGQKPLQIISSHLNVGTYLRPDASDGNTQVFVNGREITKVELQMFKFAGIRCPRNSHLWVHEDGACEEEGMNYIQGYVWGKAGMKLLCAVLSLPFPSRSFYSSGESFVPQYIGQQTVQRLLLIGCSRSGMSTIFKRAKILYKDIPFSEDERENGKLLIQKNTYGYISMLLKGREHFEEECLKELYDESGVTCTGCGDDDNEKTMYSICPRLKALADWLLHTVESGVLEAFPTSTLLYAPLIFELWRDGALQETFKRRSELERLPTVASYFLEQVSDILKPDYKPSHMDILYAEGFSSFNGLSYVDFSIQESMDDDGTDSGDLQEFQLIRSPAKSFEENCQWLETFEDVRIVIFCVSLIDYDEFVIDSNGDLVSKMKLNREFFESTITHPTFNQTDFILLLTKFDLFKEKIKQVPLSLNDWFDDFHPLIGSFIIKAGILGESGFHYIARKFKKLYSALTGRKLYVLPVDCLEIDSVDATLKYAHEILKWNKVKNEYLDYSSDESFYTDEES